MALVLPEMEVQEALSLTFESLPCTGGDLFRAQLLGRRPVIDFPYTRKPRAAPCCGRLDQRAGRKVRTVYLGDQREVEARVFLPLQR